jgi:hypothetical protein
MLPAVSGFFVARFSGLPGFLDFVACLVVSWTHSFPRAQRGSDTDGAGTDETIRPRAPKGGSFRADPESGRCPYPFVERPAKALWQADFHVRAIQLVAICRQ